MILLDTHVWLWLNVNPERLSRRSLEILCSPRHEIFLSPASSWEIAIKCAAGKLSLPEPPDVYIPHRMAANRINSLPVHHGHALRAAALPEHHKDPFDRMLIAQAQMENMKLMTVDGRFDDYDVEILWAD
ncbi:MAG TPA: type II toxin-antitoxin system VapC family toxin [Thermoanaerobaculia bacterium]|nr:type II toxin-antitoxin system VapC family toxin [Thermoanaerobaculia bacterium]